MPTALRIVVCLSAALLGQAADKPSVRATAVGNTGLTVVAADPAGLDTLSISWPEGDLQYDTGLSGAARFQRTFALRDVFPGAAPGRPLRLTVSVRNTRGAVADTKVVIPPQSSKRK